MEEVTYEMLAHDPNHVRLFRGHRHVEVRKGRPNGPSWRVWHHLIIINKRPHLRSEPCRISGSTRRSYSLRRPRVVQRPRRLHKLRVLRRRNGALHDRALPPSSVYGRLAGLRRRQRWCAARRIGWQCVKRWKMPFVMHRKGSRRARGRTRRRHWTRRSLRDNWQGHYGHIRVCHRWQPRAVTAVVDRILRYPIELEQAFNHVDWMRYARM